MDKHHKINYLEIPTTDITRAKSFFHTVFDWEFVDYGPEYSCFLKQGIDGGFYQSDKAVNVNLGAPLLVIYSANLEATQHDVEKSGGKVIKAIFSFPGGRRFHFEDPTGNEYAVWSE
ncbi:MAG: VOC family protein [Aestuariibacter sp.]